MKTKQLQQTTVEDVAEALSESGNFCEVFTVRDVNNTEQPLVLVTDADGLVWSVTVEILA